MGKCDLDEARVYVTSAKTYNTGDRSGTWVDLKGIDDKKGLIKACENLFDKEKIPGIRFLDWEHIPMHFISETDISKNFFDLLIQYKELDNTEKIGFGIWLGRHQQKIPDMSAERIVEIFRMSYQGYFGYKQQFTTHYAKEELGITKEGSPRFDFITFGKYLFEDLYIIDSGFIFRKIQY